MKKIWKRNIKTFRSILEKLFELQSWKDLQIYHAYEIVSCNLKNKLKIMEWFSKNGVLCALITVDKLKYEENVH